MSTLAIAGLSTLLLNFLGEQAVAGFHRVEMALGCICDVSCPYYAYYGGPFVRLSGHHGISVKNRYCRPLPYRVGVGRKHGKCNISIGRLFEKNQKGYRKSSCSLREDYS